MADFPVDDARISPEMLARYSTTTKKQHYNIWLKYLAWLSQQRASPSVSLVVKYSVGMWRSK
jgi:hypothetical protein